ncbi:MAG TPA: N(4)-(beta-N-acetylglucosaminyl)-L-asparaginase [Acidobacteriota bacterium]|nr:N(4)-(beta-N-acetylglucosaminyl)-L-asparaginase [Acidobacteriota bacterium]
MNRREFLQNSAGAAALATATVSGRLRAQSAATPVVVSSANGLQATERAMQLLRDGADTLEAVVSGVALVENDPEDRSVGYGGLPNEEGVVQLDASVMHGPTRGAAGVGAVENIRNPARLAKLVMERTDHVHLMGEGAKRFALQMGMQETDLLTEESRRIWWEWKRSLSDRDDWIDPEERIPASMRPDRQAALRQYMRHHGTINCNAVNAKGEISGVTTTSGLAFKIPGRVGDSPIIGAGLYVDNEVGACGSTGRGEANLKTCASFLAVEFMRNGDSPEEAGLKVLRRIAENTTEPYLLNEQGRPRFNVNFYLVDKKGRHAGVAMYSGGRYAAFDASGNRIRESAYLYKRSDER